MIGYVKVLAKEVTKPNIIPSTTGIVLSDEGIVFRKKVPINPNTIEAKETDLKVSRVASESIRSMRIRDVLVRR
ncbi:hypothetical protein TC41_1732 [Alicyclobacillus acidocaldarius subsp. acidocaldarius Tc-4-1]|uniref:Uncharacterized protein n=1 Tax=Alicyclobacillus acidocaldarius (strain Tc-4-1) TaxID=1048834 RepID=F8IL93_ALIAT|nr:hypothetical protein TC41_1732 [Alicyclobacillus acidocaldarius subsp. acidocaldarius Tc-4-1]